MNRRHFLTVLPLAAMAPAPALALPPPCPLNAFVGRAYWPRLASVIRYDGRLWATDGRMILALPDDGRYLPARELGDSFQIDCLPSYLSNPPVVWRQLGRQPFEEYVTCEECEGTGRANYRKDAWAEYVLEKDWEAHTDNNPWGDELWIEPAALRVCARCEGRGKQRGAVIYCILPPDLCPEGSGRVFIDGRALARAWRWFPDAEFSVEAVASAEHAASRLPLHRLHWRSGEARGVMSLLDPKYCGHVEGRGKVIMQLKILT